jgi:hypothetical protein
MARLPPLRVPKRQIGKARQTCVELPELPTGVPGKIELGSLTKQTSDLLNVNNCFCFSVVFIFILQENINH